MSEISALLKEIEDVKIDGAGTDNLNESLRALVTHDQKLTTLIEKGKVTGMLFIVFVAALSAVIVFRALPAFSLWCYFITCERSYV